jgi:hypothetical protein
MKKNAIFLSIFCLSITLALSGCAQKNTASQSANSTATDQSPKKSQENVNVAIEENKDGLSATVDFNDFWSKLKQDADNWSRGQYFFVDIENQAVASNIMKVDSRGGQAAAWSGSMVKCNELKAPGKFEADQTKICKGNKRTFMMFINKDGKTETASEDDTVDFFNSEYFRADSVKITAADAEARANKARNYVSKGVENYNLQLKKDSKAQKIIWTVAMSCPYKAQAEKKCSENDHWSVRIDAETGATIR